MNNEYRLIKMFGVNDYNLADLPAKYSGTKITRIFIGEEIGCSYCFPHGIETRNSHYFNRQRCWKKYRRTQWKHQITNRST